MKVRKGHQVAEIAEKDGKLYTEAVRDYPSINLAKKANGLGSRTLKKGENFPPRLHELKEAA